MGSLWLDARMAVSDPISAPRVETDRRRLRTRAAIMAAGRDLFSEHHPEGVTVDEVVRAAGISKQTFYNHFADKDALAADILREARYQLDGLVAAAYVDEPDPARRIATAMCIYAAQSLSDRQLGQIITRLSLDDVSPSSPNNAPVLADVRAGLESGRLAVLSIETGVAFVIGSCRSLVSRALLNAHPALAATTAQQFIILVLRAFAIPPIEAEIIATDVVARHLPNVVTDQD